KAIAAFKKVGRELGTLKDEAAEAEAPSGPQVVENTPALRYTLRGPEARGLADAALVAAGGVGVGVVAHFYRKVLTHELLGIQVFALFGLDAHGRVQRKDNGVAG
nr:hypothetical protein [Tanacetum cinerariifolium]